MVPVARTIGSGPAHGRRYRGKPLSEADKVLLVKNARQKVTRLLYLPLPFQLKPTWVALPEDPKLLSRIVQGIILG